MLFCSGINTAGYTDIYESIRLHKKPVSTHELYTKNAYTYTYMYTYEYIVLIQSFRDFSVSIIKMILSIRMTYSQLPTYVTKFAKCVENLFAIIDIHYSNPLNDQITAYLWNHSLNKIGNVFQERSFLTSYSGKQKGFIDYAFPLVD